MSKIHNILKQFFLFRFHLGSTMIRLFTQKLSTGMLTHRAVENVRFISQTSRILEKSPAAKTPAETPTPTSQPAAEAASGSSSAAPWQKTSLQRTLSGYDKRILVWTGKFKSIDDVPPTVSYVFFDEFSKCSYNFWIFHVFMLIYFLGMKHSIVLVTNSELKAVFG